MTVPVTEPTCNMGHVRSVFPSNPDNSNMKKLWLGHMVNLFFMNMVAYDLRTCSSRHAHITVGAPRQ
jgi:hypothetical protein